MSKLILLFSILFLTGCATNQTEPVVFGAGDPIMVEMLVVVTDTSPSKLPKEERSAEILAEEKKGNAKQGYIITAKPQGYEWGKLERDPKRFIIVTIPTADFNSEWVKPEYDKDGNIITFRKYRLPLESVLSAQEISDLKAITYNDQTILPPITKTLTDKTKVIVNDFSQLPNEIKLHGSSGTFTICSSGCNYTALATAVSTEAADLTGTGPANFNITGAFQDTTEVTVTGYTTTASDYIYIYTSGTGRHSGTWSTSAYRLNPNTSVDALSADEEYVRVEGLQISNQGRRHLRSDTTATGTHYYSHNIIRGNNDYAAAEGIELRGSTFTTYYIYNNIIYGVDTGSTDGIADGIAVVGAVDVFMYNNTVTETGGYGILITGEAVTVYNNVVKNAAGTDYYDNTGSGSFTGTNNGYEDADPGTGGVNVSGIASTALFVDPSSEDFHLKTGSSLISAGTDNPGSGLFSDDIDGETRTSTWDIGADEYVAAAASGDTTKQQEVIFFD